MGKPLVGDRSGASGSELEGVQERYGRIGDQERFKASDGMTVDHGSTEVLVAKRKSSSRDAGLLGGLK